MLEVNIWAVLLAAGSAFMLGGLWYSAALFGNAWNREAGRGPKLEGPKHPARVFGVSFLFALISAWAFALWLGPAPELSRAVLWGAVAGAAFVAASFGINYQFADRSTKLWLIDGGYHTVQFTLYGLVLGLWHQ